jgi:hypothetical protein
MFIMGMVLGGLLGVVIMACIITGKEDEGK